MAGFLASVPCLELSDRFLQAEAEPSGEFRIFDAWLILLPLICTSFMSIHKENVTMQQRIKDK